MRLIPEDKEKFEKEMSRQIKRFEERMRSSPLIEKEWQDVIWGMHRVLEWLDVDIEEDNDIF